MLIFILSVNHRTSASMPTQHRGVNTVEQYQCGCSHRCCFIDITLICLGVDSPYSAMNWPVWRWRKSRVGGLIIRVWLCWTGICFVTWKQRADKLMLLISSDSSLLYVQISPRHRHQLLTGFARWQRSCCAHLASSLNRKSRLLSAVMLSGIHGSACRAYTLKHTRRIELTCWLNSIGVVCYTSQWIK